LHELASLTPGQDWPAIEHTQIRRLAATLHARGLDPRSIARKLSSWRGFSTGWANSSRLSNPVQNVRPPKRAKSLPRALSVDDAVPWSAAPQCTPAPAPNRPSCATAPCSNCCIQAACGYPN
jgi:integrase/recombinase XerC